MGGTYDALQRSVHSIAESLLDVAQIEGVESINIHVISDRRYGDGSGYISGFAVNGKRLLFDFCEIVGSDE